MAKVLVVSATPTHPTNAGNRARILNLCTLLQGAGHDVHFLHIQRERGDDVAMAASFGIGHWRSTPHQSPRRRESGVRRLLRRCLQWVSIDSRYRWGIDDWFTDTTLDACRAWHAEVGFDAVIVNYVFMSRALLAFDETTLRIIDTHDRFADRHRMLLRQGIPPQFFSTSPEGERSALARADVVLAIQDGEAAYFRQLGAREVLTVGHLLRLEPQTPALRGSGLNLLFVASANPINVVGLQTFLETCWPALRARIPGITLQLVGSVSQGMNLPVGVHAVGEVTDLQPCYQAADLVINPVRTGTGLAIKSIEALGHGRGLVSTPEGARGLEQAIGNGIRVVRSEREWIEALVELAGSPQLRASQGEAAWRFAQGWNAQAVAGLMTLLDRRVPRSPAQAGDADVQGA